VNRGPTFGNDTDRPREWFTRYTPRYDPTVIGEGRPGDRAAHCRPLACNHSSDPAVVAVRALGHHLDGIQHRPAPAVWAFGLTSLYPTAVSSDFPVPLVGLQVTDYGPDARVVTVTGELDALTAPTLAACLSAQLAVAQVVVVNLNGLKFLASAGLRVLFETNELAVERDRRLRFVCNCPIANLALETTGLRQHLTFADDVTDALSNEP
jgi:anti-sigma B factor antagonist